MADPGAFERVGERVARLFEAYDPPDFAHVPDPDAALFLTAVDHRTGYRRAHLVAGEGPLEGSELMWAVALAAAGRAGPGCAPASCAASPPSGSRMPSGSTARRSPTRSAARRCGATSPRGLELDYGGEAAALLGAAEGMLGGEHGLLERLARYRAYADPLQKKAQLYAKICERRGWFEVGDPESWEVAADNVLMRLALRSGVVEPGGLDAVRAATRAAFKRIATETRIPPPLLDDLLWELGRDDPDLLGCEAGDLHEPATRSVVAVVLSQITWLDGFSAKSRNQTTRATNSITNETTSIDSSGPRTRAPPPALLARPRRAARGRR